MDFNNFLNFNMFNAFGTNSFFVPNFGGVNNSSLFNNLNIPQFNFNFNFTSVFDTGNLSSGQKSFAGITDTCTFSNKKKFSFANYNAVAGERLARTALKNAPGAWTGYCARHVKKAIAESNLGKYTTGHAYQMAEVLRNNKNFKEISPIEYNVKDLPAGCVLVYDRGSEGYSKKYGHTEITTGDKRAVSDGITKNLRQPDAIFMPVYA